MSKLRVKCFLFIILFIGIHFSTIGVSFGNDISISDEKVREIYGNTLNLLGIKMDEGILKISATECLSNFGTVTGFAKRVDSKKAVVEIDIQTGKIILIRDEKIRRTQQIRVREAVAQGKEIEPTKQKEEIIVIAKEYYKRLGQTFTPDTKLRVVRFNPKNGAWELVWNRYIEDYRFEDEWLGISIDDLTGKLSRYSNTLTTKHVDTDIKISKENAIQIARTHVTAILPKLVMNQKFIISKIGQAELRVVYPNYLVTEKIEKMTEEELLSAAQNPRLAYSINFKFRYVGSKEALRINRSPITIWVDVITGEVVGGIM